MKVTFHFIRMKGDNNMGQRSQIYVRYGNKLVVANYYQWNFGERMISRARYGIEYIKDNLIQYKDYIFNNSYEMKRLGRIFDVNFDMKDVQMGENLVQEWKEQFSDEKLFNDVVFKQQDNNDGKLFVDILKDGTIKYAFLDSECDIENVMSANQYMDRNYKNWKKSKFIESEQKLLCINNIKAIKEMAELMTKEEVEDFIQCKYEI